LVPRPFLKLLTLNGAKPSSVLMSRGMRLTESILTLLRSSLGKESRDIEVG
jgi:hypothetical protein